MPIKLKSVVLGVVCLAASAILLSCTEAKRAEYTRYGDSAKITASQFGIELYSGESTGKLNAKEGGYLFVEKSTGDTVQIKGDAIAYVIRYAKE